jgi:hypothetical protein
MAQAGRTRGRNGRRKKGVSDGMVSARSRSQIEARVKRGVVEGAEPELCPVCGVNSEGWYIEGGKRTWYHFGRTFPCVEKVGHIAASAEGAPGAGGPVPGVQ